MPAQHMPAQHMQFTDGEAYEQLMGRWSRKVGAQFLEWLNVPTNKDWLDVGCGNGAFTQEILANSQPKTVTGIDPAPAQIAYAKTRIGTAAAQFQMGSAQELPFETGQFDVAAMALVISFLPDAAKAVTELTRVVKPGGTVATYMWDLPAGVPVGPIYKTLAKLGHPAPLPPNPAISKIEALQALWQNAGLNTIETKVLHIEVSFTNFDDFWQSNSIPIGPQGKFIEALPQAVRDELQVELKATLPTQVDGRIIYESFANAVKGIRK